MAKLLMPSELWCQIVRNSLTPFVEFTHTLEWRKLAHYQCYCGHRLSTHNEYGICFGHQTTILMGLSKAHKDSNACPCTIENMPAYWIDDLYQEVWVIEFQ